MDYDGVMGVPITFLDKYNPEQFEIVKFRKGDDEKDLSIKGECPYFRILIRRRQRMGDVVGQLTPYEQSEATLPLAAEDPEPYNQNR